MCGGVKGARQQTCTGSSPRVREPEGEGMRGRGRNGEPGGPASSQPRRLDLAGGTAGCRRGRAALCSGKISASWRWAGLARPGAGKEAGPAAAHPVGRPLPSPAASAPRPHRPPEGASTDEAPGPPAARGPSTPAGLTSGSGGRESRPHSGRGGPGRRWDPAWARGAAHKPPGPALSVKSGP